MIIGCGVQRMGKIYTSYFGNLHKIKDKGIVPISISAFPPKWYNGEKLRFLAPDVTMFIGYKENYMKVILAVISTFLVLFGVLAWWVCTHIVFEYHEITPVKKLMIV